MQQDEAICSSFFRMPSIAPHLGSSSRHGPGSYHAGLARTPRHVFSSAPSPDAHLPVLCSSHNLCRLQRASWHELFFLFFYCSQTATKGSDAIRPVTCRRGPGRSQILRVSQARSWHPVSASSGLCRRATAIAYVHEIINPLFFFHFIRGSCHLLYALVLL